MVSDRGTDRATGVGCGDIGEGAGVGEGWNDREGGGGERLSGHVEGPVGGQFSGSWLLMNRDDGVFKKQAAQGADRNGAGGVGARRRDWWGPIPGVVPLGVRGRMTPSSTSDHAGPQRPVRARRSDAGTVRARRAILSCCGSSASSTR